MQQYRYLSVTAAATGSMGDRQQHLWVDISTWIGRDISFIPISVARVAMSAFCVAVPTPFYLKNAVIFYKFLLVK